MEAVLENSKTSLWKPLYDSEEANDNSFTIVYPFIVDLKEETETGIEVSAPEEVTHDVFFGENIKRVSKLLISEK